MITRKQWNKFCIDLYGTCIYFNEVYFNGQRLKHVRMHPNFSIHTNLYQEAPRIYTFDTAKVQDNFASMKLSDLYKRVELCNISMATLIKYRDMK
jgi:hypothetical protein